MNISIGDITQILPHSFPFLLVDKVLSTTAEVQEGRITTQKYISAGDIVVCAGTYPPLLILESMAQSAGILAHYYLSEITPGQQCFFASIRKSRFYDVVRCGDVLHTDIEFRRKRKHIFSFSGTASVEGKIVCTADFMCAKQ